MLSFGCPKTRARPLESHNVWGGALALWGKAEGAGFVYSEEEGIWGRPNSSFTYLQGCFSGGETGILMEVPGRMGDSSHALKQERFTLCIEENSFPCKDE